LIGQSYDSDWDHFINLKKPAWVFESSIYAAAF
jgi:hypothetical protein